MQISDKIAASFISHSVDIQRYSESVRGNVVKFLEALGSEISSMLNDADLSSLALVKKRRLNALLKDIEAVIDKHYATIEVHVSDSMRETAAIEARATVRAINTALGVELFSSTLTQEFLAAIAGNTLIAGADNKTWWSRQADSLAGKVKDQVRMGIGLNESTKEIVARIRGTNTGRRVRYTDAEGKTRYRIEYAGGALGAPSRHAETLVLTSIFAASSETKDSLYKENDDLVKGRQALAVLDTKTSELCRGRAGMSWNMQGKGLNGTTIDFPGAPPWHWRCRTILLPILKSWEELGANVKNKKKINKDTQASMNGQVASDLNYNSWLKTQNEATQRKVLGEGKYELWKKNELTLSEMLDQRGNPMSLRELKEKYN